MKCSSSRFGMVLVLGSLAGGCTEQQIRVYEVPKEIAPASVAPMAMAPSVPKLHWTLPEGWEEVPVSSGMRAASFVIRETGGDRRAEVSVVALPGVSAVMTDIVNMWREQVGLGVVEPSEVAKLVEQVRVGEGKGELFDMVGGESASAGTPTSRILVAIARDNEVSWFFKMTGDNDFVGDKKPDFLEFLRTVTFDYPNAPAMAGSASSGARGFDSGAKPRWTVPGGWREAPPTSVGLAKFTMGDADSGQAEMTVTVLSGTGGGTLANVNRWRGQIGLSALDEAGLAEATTSFEEAGSGAILMEMTGQQRLVAAILFREGQSWFYKMTGDAAVVEREKGAFIEFVKTVDYSNVH